MQKIISLPFIKTIVYANVFISLCAMAMVWVTYIVFSIQFNVENNSYLLFILLSTYLQYNVQRGYLLQKHHVLNDRSQWIAQHKKALLISVAVCLITVLFLCNALSYTSIAIMVGAELLSTLYYLPPFNLRKYGYVKPFLISLIWVISCVTVPLIENQLLDINSVWFMVSQFLFIATLCVLFDIKDADDDYLTGVNTYANSLGLKVTQIISVVLIILSSCCYVFFKPPSNSLLLSSMMVSFVVAISIFFTNEKRHTFYYYLWIDGLILIQALVVLILDYSLTVLS